MISIKVIVFHQQWQQPLTNRLTRNIPSPPRPLELQTESIVLYVEGRWTYTPLLVFLPRPPSIGRFSFLNAALERIKQENGRTIKQEQREKSLHKAFWLCIKASAGSCEGTACRPTS